MVNQKLVDENETHLLFKQNKIITKNISNGIIRSLIAWNLTIQDLHGYALMKKIDEFFEPQIKAGLINEISNSKVYPILAQMEKEGLLESYTGMNNNNEVKFYKITPKGIRVFETIKQDLQKNLKRAVVKEYFQMMFGVDI